MPWNTKAKEASRVNRKESNNEVTDCNLTVGKHKNILLMFANALLPQGLLCACVYGEILRLYAFNSGRFLFVWWQCLFIRFHRCCWISTVTVASHVRDYWELRVKGNLTERSDTGSVNHSPTSSAPLTVRLQYGCSHTIPISGKLRLHS